MQPDPRPGMKHPFAVAGKLDSPSPTVSGFQCAVCSHPMAATSVKATPPIRIRRAHVRQTIRANRRTVIQSVVSFVM
jgi:hypothetical protein